MSNNHIPINDGKPKADGCKPSVLSELLYCPFCGGNVRLETTIMDTPIICKKCRLFMIRSNLHKNDAQVKETLVKCWNHRAT